MKYFYPLIVLLIAFSMTSTQATSIKKWTDENGRVYYGDTPPRSVKAKTITTNKRPTNIGKPLPRLSTSSSEPSLDKKTTSPAPKSPDTLNPEQAKATCEIAKKNLRVLENNSDIQLRSADGSARYMTPDEIQQRLDRSNDDIAKFCN